MTKTPTPPTPVTNSVDLVIPVYGQAAFLLECLNSLYHHDAGVPFNVFLVDDLGPEREAVDLVYRQFESKPNLRVLRNPANRGFAATCNAGFKAGKAPLVLFLNSDTRIVQPGWLKVMADEFADPKVGVVGPAIMYFRESTDPERPGGKVQTAGIAFNLEGMPYEAFKGWRINNPHIRRRELQAVTGACLMTRRTLYGAVEMMDPVFTAGNFEDVDLCLRIARSGYKVVCNPLAVIEHYSGGSSNSLTAQKNAAIFRARWFDYLPALWDEPRVYAVAQ